MTNDRVYRKAIPEEQAWQKIVRNSGTQFDPGLVEVFIGLATAETEPVADDEAPDEVSAAGQR
jgi:HD-GYP domain-containing protein (c-di-GMP phosphodiesterase class II)